jgi:hypothetical protein|tara:strand:- start:753 stop:896 length:144 start_codon:yes stop_codon:yes gene_type:complete
MIPKEWIWMYMDKKNKDLDIQDNLEDGIDDFITTIRPTPYCDDDFEY